MPPNIFGGPALSASERLRNIMQARQQLPKPPGPAPEEEDLDLASLGQPSEGGLAAPSFEMGQMDGPNEGLESLGRPQLSARRMAPQAAPQAPQAPQGRFMPDIGTASAAAAERARTGQSLESIYEAKGLKRYAGGNDLDYLRDQAKANNNKAQENLWIMAGKDPEKYQNLLYGRTDAEREGAAEAESKRRFDADHGLKEKGFYEGARRFDAGLDEQKAARESGEQYKKMMAEIERRYKEGSISLQEAKIAADKAASYAANDLDRRRVALQERQHADSLQPKPVDPLEQEGKELGLRLQRAQVSAAEGQLAGNIPAPEQRAQTANLIAAANARAAALKEANPTMHESEVRSRIMQELGPQASAAGIKLNPETINVQEKYVGTGLQDLGTMARGMGTTTKELLDKAYESAISKQVPGAGAPIVGGIGNWLGRQMFSPREEYQPAMVEYLVGQVGMDPRAAQALVQKYEALK